MGAEIRLACHEDARELAPRLRERDVAEVRAASGNDPLDALHRGIELSTYAWTALDDEGPFAIFGVTPYLPEMGSPWLLGADRLVTKHRRFFLRHTRAYVDRMTRHYPLLANYVDVRNADSLAFLEFAGFSIDKFIPRYGHEGRPFLRFTKVSPYV